MNDETTDDHIFDVHLDKDRLEGYITGFFDADGHVGLYIYKGVPKPVISFSNNSVHILNFIKQGFEMFDIDFHIYPKSRQLRIDSWKDEHSLREVIDFLVKRSQVKRNQLKMMLMAINKYYSLPGDKKKQYNPQDKDEFRELAEKIKEQKFLWRPKNR